MLAIPYPPNSYRNMSLSHLTTFTTVFLKTPITRFYFLRKIKRLCCFRRPNTVFILHWIDYSLSQKHLYLISVDTSPHNCSMPNTKMSHSNAQSMALFHGLVTINEKCYCSHTLCTVSQKCCASEQGRCCAVLKLGKFHKPNSILPTHYRKTRTTFPVPIPSFKGPTVSSARQCCHLFEIWLCVKIVIGDWWGLKLTAWRGPSDIWDCYSVSGVKGRGVDTETVWTCK